MEKSVHILFLHHSTGASIWRGKTNRILYKLTKKGDVEKYLNQYNKSHCTNYVIREQCFPKSKPYGWKNYPYDYYNIWVKNAGDKLFKEEPTLEMLTKIYDVIIWKHCFPVSGIKKSNGLGDVDSNIKTLENYKLQYNALKSKMYNFPNTKFIVWTPPALVKDQTTREEADRANVFSEWIINEWDQPDDNIFIWDFRQLESDGGLYLKPDFANNLHNSHPNSRFSGMVSRLCANRIIDVIESNGSTTSLSGEKK